MSRVEQKRQARLEELRAMRRTANVELVKPVSKDGEPGNTNYFKQMRHLRDLLDAASTQASFIGVQATRMSRGDPMTNDMEWRRAQAAWNKLGNEMIDFSNEIYKLYRQVQKRA